jgi:hypothetical protein
MKRALNPRLGAVIVASALVISFKLVAAQQGGGGAVAIDADDIGGVVTSAKGPEAGVWVIAETTELPTKFARMVVTDDQGRYVVPDLPQANYQVFVRGYGLVDSARVAAKPGQRLDLKGVVAPDGRAAAQVYPANYWLSLLEIPKGEHSPRTSRTRPRRASRAIRSAPRPLVKFPRARWPRCSRPGIAIRRWVPTAQT